MKGEPVEIQQQSQEQNQSPEKSIKDIASEILNEERTTPQDGNQTQPKTKPSTTQPDSAASFDPSKLEIPSEALGEPAQAKKPEPAKPEEEPEEIRNANTKTREAFARLRTQLAQVQEQLNAKQKIDPAQQQAQADPDQMLETKKQVETLKQQLQQAYDQIGKFSLEADPRFKARYAGQQAAILEQVKDIAKEWEIKEEHIEAILRATPKKRVEIINEIAPDAMPVLSPLFAQYDHIERMKQTELLNHRQLREQLDSEQQKSRAISEQTGKIALLQQAAAKVLQDGHFVLRPIQGQEEWNKNVDVLQKKVQYLFQQNDPAAQAEHLILGVTAPVYLALFKRERAARMAVEEKMKKLFGMKPELDASQHEAPPAKKPEGSASDIVRGILSEEMN
jgi:hypothetical protein